MKLEELLVGLEGFFVVAEGQVGSGEVLEDCGMFGVGIWDDLEG